MSYFTGLQQLELKIHQYLVQSYKKGTRLGISIGIWKVWSWNWLVANCHNIVYRSIHRESGETDVVAIKDWTEDNMTNILNEYALLDIYNVDKNALFHQMLP